MVCSLETVGGKIGSKALKPEEFSRFHMFSSLHQAATTSLRVNLTTSARSSLALSMWPFWGQILHSHATATL